MADHPPLYFVRHGETDWNREHRIQGRRDIQMNGLGRAQAAAVARRLEELVNDPGAFDFYASPLARTRETMAPILAGFGLPRSHAHYDERLVERGFGAFDGRTWQELFAAGVDPDVDPAAYHDWRPDGGESLADVAERVAEWLATVGRPAIVVSHGGVSRVLRGLMLGLDKAEIVHLDVPQHRFFRIAEGKIAWFDLSLEPS